MGQAHKKVYDLLIFGAGIPGASLALSSARQGLSVALVDRRAGLDGTGDTRTTAWLPESIATFEQLGIWGQVAAKAAPLKAMRLYKGNASAPPLTFEPMRAEALAANLPNAQLEAALGEAITQEPTLDLIWSDTLAKAQEHQGFAEVYLSSGLELQAKICVAADGRNSPLREALSLKWRAAENSQIALTARLKHSQAHAFVSSEIHRGAGPMTFVPVPGTGHECALVWCVHDTTAARLQAMDDAAFTARLQMLSGGILGQIDQLSKRAAFPVRPGMAATFHQGPFALMAEAAHVLPPLLAQGLNLSMSDVAYLVQQIAAQGPTPKALAAYAATRRADAAARLLIAQGLNKVLTQGPAVLQAAYGGGYRLLRNSKALSQAAIWVGQRGVQHFTGA